MIPPRPIRWNEPTHRRLLLAVALVLAGHCGVDARADLLRLHGGGELRGQIDWKQRAAQKLHIQIGTLSGARFTVMQDDVEFVAKRSLTHEEYELRSRVTPMTVEAQWELADWCVANRLTRERQVHLHNVISLAPNHEPARRALKHVQHQGRWMSRDERAKATGYVKYRNRYVTPQEYELLQKTSAELEREKVWFKKIRLWMRWVKGRHAGRRTEALSKLQGITDPDAVHGLVHFMRDAEQRAIRALYITTLSQILGPKPIAPLVTQALHDIDEPLREAALRAIGQEYYEVALPVFIEALKHDHNVVVRRAGAAIRQVGDETAVPALIEALITRHYYRVRVPDNSNTYGFRSDGGFADAGSTLPDSILGMIQSGQLPHGAVVMNSNHPAQKQPMKTVQVRHDHRNSEVLSALRGLTGKDYGYDSRTWRLWWNARKSGVDGDVPVLP